MSPRLNSNPLGRENEVIIAGWHTDLDTPLMGSHQPESTLQNVLRHLYFTGVKVYVLGYEMAAGRFQDEYNTKIDTMEKLWELGILYFSDWGYASYKQDDTECSYKKPGDNMEAIRMAHVKNVIINREIAYVGGIDIYTDKLQTPSHDRYHMKRRSAKKHHHDTQCRVTGKAAADIASVHINRWRKGCKTLKENFDAYKLTSLFADREKIFEYMCQSNNLPPTADEWKEVLKVDKTSRGDRLRKINRSLLGGKYASATGATNAECRALVTGDWYWLRNAGYSYPITTIYDTTLRLIDGAKKISPYIHREHIEAPLYVYIENQYFISSALRPFSPNPDLISDPHDFIQPRFKPASGDLKADLPESCRWDSESENFHAKNKLGKSLYKRIKRAIEKNEDFSVVLVTSMSAKEAILFYNRYFTLFDKDCGLIPALERVLEEARKKDAKTGTNKVTSKQLKNYFTVLFHGKADFETNKEMEKRRQQAKEGKEQAPDFDSRNGEIVFYNTYVHSKERRTLYYTSYHVSPLICSSLSWRLCVQAMIVDGEYAIIGSANMNDRSMLGYMDLETAMEVRGREAVKSFRDQLFKPKVHKRIAPTYAQELLDKLDKKPHELAKLFHKSAKANAKALDELTRGGQTPFTILPHLLYLDTNFNKQSSPGRVESQTRLSSTPWATRSGCYSRVTRLRRKSKCATAWRPSASCSPGTSASSDRTLENTRNILKTLSSPCLLRPLWEMLHTDAAIANQFASVRTNLAAVCGEQRRDLSFIRKMIE
ncbi:unnamed protein product [Vitrella brassicaformis CCMP3155]|uniref:phospholipase D n=1 Tax=Vitrella brassicaformis (strain CCMP3155) TaxID=1169540 RepID=A0A0G4FLW5_VITBC|nr:unnamed protein product [Vitrella brassicaformis CCMP3155]|eukprot:CEM15012.1 unnamed protein product [Vitrella brassicaformis CCMP3155]